MAVFSLRRPAPPLIIPGQGDNRHDRELDRRRSTMGIRHAFCNYSGPTARWLAGSLVLVLLLTGGVRAELTTEKLAELVKPTIPLKWNFRNKDGKVTEFDVKILSENQESVLAIPSKLVIDKQARPLDVPWEAQRFLEALRIYHPAVMKEEVWKTFLDAAEKVVARELTLLGDNKGGDKELMGKLWEQNDEFNKLFMTALKDYAKSKGKKGGPGYGAPGEYVVGFVLKPDAAGAAVSLVGVAYLRAAELAGVDKRPDIWRDVPRGKTVKLKYGEYWVRASWPEAGSVEKKLLIDRDDKIDLEPDPKRK
jgi:hypothetical protein